MKVACRIMQRNFLLCDAACQRRSETISSCVHRDSAHDWHHFPTMETPSDASFCTDCYTSWPHTTGRRTEKKISKHGRNAAKVSGCAGVINVWVSLRGRQQCWSSSLCSRLLYFHYAYVQTHMHKQKQCAAMTSLENRRSAWSCQRAHFAPVTSQNIASNVWTCHCGICHNSWHVDELTHSVCKLILSCLHLPGDSSWVSHSEGRWVRNKSATQM